MDDMQRRKMCFQKKRFKDEIEVKMVLAKASKKIDVKRYYQCPICHGFHMTSTRRSGRG